MLASDIFAAPPAAASSDVTIDALRSVAYSQSDEHVAFIAFPNVSIEFVPLRL